jgi:ribonucleoside-triphosphate reductase
MRNLEDIEKDLTAAREALSRVEGTPAEVYSRIVGYYRSVRNWNRGKREEYGERRLYRVKGMYSDEIYAAASSPPFALAKDFAGIHSETSAEFSQLTGRASPAYGSLPEETLLLLFVRDSCPHCPPAKDAAEELGIPVKYINADTAEGKAEAIRRKVMSTPLAILLSPDGKELGRAINEETIGRLLEKVPVAEPIAV